MKSSTLWLLVICGCFALPVIINMVKKWKHKKFLAALPQGFVQIRRNELAIHPERGEILFYPGNYIYAREQLASPPDFDIELEEITREGKVCLSGEPDIVLDTVKDEVLLTTTDSREWRFSVKEAYDKTYAILRNFYFGELTREQLKNAGFEA